MVSYRGEAAQVEVEREGERGEREEAGSGQGGGTALYGQDPARKAGGESGDVSPQLHPAVAVGDRRRAEEAGVGGQRRDKRGKRRKEKEKEETSVSGSPWDRAPGRPLDGARAWLWGWLGCAVIEDTCAGVRREGWGLLGEALVTVGEAPPGAQHHWLCRPAPGPWGGVQPWEPSHPLPTQGGRGTRQPPLPGAHLEAVKMCLALVQMALMGLSWPLISPMGVKFSTLQTLMMPARQALSSRGWPGTKARAHTQSLCALGICWGRTGG